DAVFGCEAQPLDSVDFPIDRAEREHPDPQFGDVLRRLGARGGSWHHREERGTKQRKKSAPEKSSRRHVHSSLPAVHISTFPSIRALTLGSPDPGGPHLPQRS